VTTPPLRPLSPFPLRETCRSSRNGRFASDLVKSSLPKEEKRDKMKGKREKKSRGPPPPPRTPELPSPFLPLPPAHLWASSTPFGLSRGGRPPSHPEWPCSRGGWPPSPPARCLAVRRPQSPPRARVTSNPDSPAPASPRLTRKVPSDVCPSRHQGQRMPHAEFPAVPTRLAPPFAVPGKITPTPAPHPAPSLGGYGLG